LGTLTPFFDATYLLTYDVTNDGTTIDALGRLNRSNIGSPNQRFKGNLGLGWTSGIASANIILRHVSEYEDDGGVEIDAFTTLDANVSFTLTDLLRADNETTLTLGVVNATDEDPPFVNVAGSYDPRTGDPRGRRVFIKIGTRF